MNIIKKIAYTGFIIIISVASLELLLRFSNSSMRNYNIEMWKYSQTLKMPSEDKDLGHEHRPNKSAVLQGVEIRTNEYGLRGANISEKSSERKILFLGSSITLGWGVKEEDTMSSVLEQRLRGRGQDVSVFNAGIGNYNARRYTKLYFDKLQVLEPTDIVVNFFLRDAEVIMAGGGNLVSRNSQLAVTIIDIWNRYSRESGEKTVVDRYNSLFQDNSGGFEVAIKSFERLANAARDDNIGIYLIMIPDIHNLDNYPLAHIHNLMAKKASDMGYIFIDMYPALADLKPREIWAMPGDPHPNALGHQLMAERMIPYFEKR